MTAADTDSLQQQSNKRICIQYSVLTGNQQERQNRTSMMPRFQWAPAAYRQLKGLLCVYKPAELPIKKMLEAIQFNLARDLNELPCYKIESQMRKIDPEADLRAPMVIDSASLVPAEDLMEHRLVLGQRYIPSDIEVQHIHGLRKYSSGVVMIGVGRKWKSSVELLALSRFLRVHHVKGRFGWATNDFTPRGKIIERTSYRHVHPLKLDKVLAMIQSTKLRNVFDCAGVHRHSQEAYELAAQGLVRPEDGHTPSVIYSIKCIDFQLPDFTLEIHSINEDCDEFMEMIHQIGLKLKSTAVCTGIRRLRYGPFDVSHGLLRQQWNLEEILDNLRQNAALLTPERLAGEGIIQEMSIEESDASRKQIDR